MKKVVFSIVILCSISISAFSQDSIKKAPTDTLIKIEEGMLIKVKSLTEINSKTASEGDLIDFTVYEDLVIKGRTVLKEGTIVRCRIEDAEKAKGVGKQGSIRIQFEFTKAIDGTKIPLRSTKSVVEGENKGTGAIALAVVVSPLFLLKKGKEAKIPAGKIMEAYVQRDVEVTVK